MKTVEGDLMGGGQRHCVVVTRWNDFIVSRLQEGALSALRRHGVNEDDVTLVVIPGAFEMGTVVRELARSGKYDAVTCLGAVIKGSTDHYDFVAGEAAGQISRAGYETGVPVIFGVLTTDTIEQAIERAGTKAGNKGFEAAATAVEMASLMQKIKGN